MKTIWMLIFLGLPIAGLWYTLWHIWQILPFPHSWRWLVAGICIVLFLTMFLAFSGFIEKMPLRLATVTYEVGNSVIFVLFYLVMLFLVLDFARWTHLIPKEWLSNNGYSTISILALTLFIFGYGYRHYLDKVRVPLEIKTTKNISLSTGTSETSFGKKAVKVVLLSDLHLGYHNRRQEFKRWVDKINNEHPDLILIGGDIIDISVRPLLEENMGEEFHRFNAPVLACLGNHEYYSGESKAQQFYREAGITLLKDSVVTMGNLRIVGRDDRTNAHRKPLKEILALAESGDKAAERPFTILLDHQPYHLEEAEQNGIDFQFSGHTHHGQVWPVSWIADALYEDAFGSLQKGKTQYYVSSGMGIWGGKFRIGTQSEYVVLTIIDNPS